MCSQRPGMGFIIGEKTEIVAGLPCSSWHDDPANIPRLTMGQDARQRSTSWVRGIVLHTTKGVPGGKDQRPQDIRSGIGPSLGAAARVARFWSNDPGQAGAHLVVDHDGSIVCVADLLLDRAFHAGTVNDCTIGVEIYQGNAAEMYAAQLAQVVKLVDWLTVRFGIQRQIPSAYQGAIARLAAGGRDIVGVYGHRDVTENRGLGDPGNAIFELLASAGYEARDFEKKEDLAEWKKRQSDLNASLQAALDVDGIPGSATRQALLAAGRPAGMWVPRPGDTSS